MSRYINTLNDQSLDIWRNINKEFWVIEINPKDYSYNEMGNVYNARNNFLLRCVEEFKIDDSRPWMVSEVTGHVFYLEDEHVESRGTERKSEESSTSKSGE